MHPPSLRVVEPSSARWRVYLILTGLLVSANALYQHALWTMVDLAVYRMGGLSIIQGRSLYGPTAGLPFTYPPFAGILFEPLARIGIGLGQALMLVLSILCYLAFVVVCARHSGLTWRVTALLVVAGLSFEPVLHTLGLGQVNFVLALLIALDCLVVSRRWRGLLVGVAIGIKLTPLVFVLYFLLKRDVRAVCLSLAGFAFTVIVAWTVVPHDSHLYWTKLFYDPGHVGRVAYPYNQGIFGVLARLLHTTSPSLALYGILSLLVVALTWYAARRQLSEGREVAALVSIATCGLLVSPVSWTHHWIWLLPAGWLLLTAGHALAAAFVTGVAVVAPLRYIPTPKSLAALHLTWWQTGISLAYTLAGIVVIVAMALPYRAVKEQPTHAAAIPPSG